MGYSAIHMSSHGTGLPLATVTIILMMSGLAVMQTGFNSTESLTTSIPMNVSTAGFYSTESPNTSTPLNVRTTEYSTREPNISISTTASASIIASLPNFYPFGTVAGDTVLAIYGIDDGSSAVINLQSPFSYFGFAYSQIYVNMNGHLTFDRPWYGYIPYQFPSYGATDIIAPLWTDIVNGYGVISYQQYTTGSVLSQATQNINQYFPGLNFTASWVFVATWNKVGYYTNTTAQSSFQVVLISGENSSFILMNYNVIAPPNQIVEAGLWLNSTRYFGLPNDTSFITNLRNSSNVNVPGRWAYKVNGQPRNVTIQVSQPLTFYPFGSGAGDTINARILDGSSPALSLQSPFTFFGRTYYQLYVSTHGHLTFSQPSTQWVPERFSAYGAKDVIAPLWTDTDNRVNGVLSYKQYTNGSVLSRATKDINQYFPGVNFTASWVFVATWDRVAYFSNSGSETSFQVVLISGGNFSFILMNYGDIAPDNYRAQAGYGTNHTDHFIILWSENKFTIQNLMYSSNVNVPGRWAFLVNRPVDAITRDDLLAVRMKLQTILNLSDSNIQKSIVQQFQDELKRRGIPSTVKVKVKSLQKTKP